MGVLLLATCCYAKPVTSGTTARQDIVYGRSDGTALTMDEFKPAQPNGAIIVCIISGGWYSAHDQIKGLADKGAFAPFLDRGYKLYAVVHRSAPRFTMEEAYADVTRAIRFIRYREAQDGRTSVSIGVTGGSAGGHLSLMLGTAGDDGDKASADPIERQSSRVQAVACFFPPTDLLNFGSRGTSVEDTFVGKYYYASIDFRRSSETKLLFRGGPYHDVTDINLRRKILREMSPVTHITADDAPTMIIHGDKDKIVPLQQSEVMMDKLKKIGVPAKLKVIKDGGHGWSGIEKEFGDFVGWFDKYLLPETNEHQEQIPGS